jgi:hypothetical protein
VVLLVLLVLLVRCWCTDMVVPCWWGNMVSSVGGIAVVTVLLLVYQHVSMMVLIQQGRRHRWCGGVVVLSL